MATTTLSLWMVRFAFAAAVIVSAVVFFFFVWGLIDGSVSSFNMGLWLTVLALPGLLYALFILLVLVTRPSWN